MQSMGAGVVKNRPEVARFDSQDLHECFIEALDLFVDLSMCKGCDVGVGPCVTGDLKANRVMSE